MSNLVPEGWSYNPLSLLADVDKDSLKTSTDPDYRFRYIDIASVSTGQVKLPSEYIKFSDAPSRARRKLQQGDVLMSTVRPNLKAFAYFDVSETDFVASTGFSVIRAKNGNDGRFIFNAILGDDISSQIDSLVVGSNYPAINSSDVKNLEVLTPSPAEQQKIAKILTSVDEVIEKTQAQIDKLKDLKTSMMQELLTQGVGVDGKPHTEFKDSPVGRIPKAWEVITLRRILEVMESGWSPQCGSESAAFGEWGVLKTTAVTWSGFNYLANKKLPDSLSPKPEIVVNKGDILVTRAGPADRVGVVVYVEFVPEHLMLSDKIIRLRAGDKVRADFLSLWLSGIFAQRYLASRVSGLATSQTNISQSILGEVPCVLPSMEEQRLIAGSIMSIQARLDCLITNLEAKKQLKKALMQDLLTGKVRVTID